MKKLLIIPVAALFFACNNKKEDKPGTVPATTTDQPAAPANDPPPSAATGGSGITYSVEGAEVKHSASLLVSKDKDKLQAGAPYLCMLTSNSAPHNNETLTLNFLLDTKPGTYPVAGASLMRGNDPNGEMYGGILGGKTKLTNYKVTVTECKDLGSNNLGGHRWSISGTWEEMVIPATGIMLMDKTKNHPTEIKLGAGTFTNLTFDDNWEEMMEEGMKKLKEK